MFLCSILVSYHLLIFPSTLPPPYISLLFFFSFPLLLSPLTSPFNPPEPLRSWQDTSLKTTPLRCHILWIWMLLRPSRLPVHGAGGDRPGTRAPLNLGPREALVLHAPDNTTSPCACSCLLSSWEPSLGRRGSPSRMSPNKHSPSKLLWWRGWLDMIIVSMFTFEGHLSQVWSKPAHHFILSDDGCCFSL